MSRLNLEMTQENRARLEMLRDTTGAESLAEVFKRAIAVYEFLWNERKKGNALIVKNGDHEKEIVLL